uniref:Pyruvate kinase n=1 Tax=Haptolina brevifila TaxID=156173 RepID=A0A7S2BE55_9EUKA
MRSIQTAAATGVPRLTKLVSTIGPASEEAEPLEGCVAAGMDVMRVNFSHATVDEFHLRRTNLRAAPGGKYVSVMLDTKGPEIRMGGLRVCKETGNRKAKMMLTAGETLTLTNDKAYDGDGDERTIYVGYDRLTEILSAGDKVLLDDGLVSLVVTDVSEKGVEAEVLNSSEIGERKGVNLPGIATGLPAMSEKDLEDIRFGIEHDIDMIAASFVRNAAGVHEIREHVYACHERYAGEDFFMVPPPLIISKIESTEALENLQEIIEASDGIMVARGDLGVEIPLDQVVTWQKDMVALCIAAGKPVIVATQMLETMQKNPRPTRAEIADVTNAVLDGADCVMLSGESANGQFPIESVETQSDICLSAEGWAKERGLSCAADIHGMTSSEEDAAEGDFTDSVSAAACFLADRINAAAVVVIEEGFGEMARAVSKHRPPIPIIAISDCLKVCRQLSISRGVYPQLFEGDDMEENGLAEMSADRACELGVMADLLKPGDTAVVVFGNGITVEMIEDMDELDGFGEDDK